MTALLLQPHVKRKWSSRAESLAVGILDSSGVTDAIIPTVDGYQAWRLIPGNVELETEDA